VSWRLRGTRARCGTLWATRSPPSASHRARSRGPGRLRYVLGNCPYRDAVRENPPAICTLHRGITRGLLERLDPGARLADFVARDPYAAGCIVDVAT
jgi:hypothetical protein